MITDFFIVFCRLNFDHNTRNMEPIQPPIMVGCYSKMSKDSRKAKDGTGDLYSGGVTRLVLLDNEKLLVGAGDGTVELIDIVDVPFNFSGKSVKLPSTPQIRTVRSLLCLAKAHFFFFVEPQASEIQ